MDIAIVKKALKILNPLDGSNPDGNCTTCAVLSADALVSGVAPIAPAPPDSTTISEAVATRPNAKKILDILPDHLRSSDQTRAYRVWTWLKKKAETGVYLFEQDEDHVYNFVVDGDPYLIDSATQVYRKVNTAGDCSVTTLAYPANFTKDEGGTMKMGDDEIHSQYGYNYLNPQTDNPLDRLHVYRWGELYRDWR